MLMSLQCGVCSALKIVVLECCLYQQSKDFLKPVHPGLVHLQQVVQHWHSWAGFDPAWANFSPWPVTFTQLTPEGTGRFQFSV